MPATLASLRKIENGLIFRSPFAVKTPLPTLILLVASLVGWTIKRRLGPYVWLIVPPVNLFHSGDFVALQHRHPPSPAYLSVSIRLDRRLCKRALAGRFGKKEGWSGLFGLWYLWSSLSSYPHYLSYFNELVGGAKNGHKVLLDSNLDWGVAAHFEFGNLWARQGKFDEAAAHYRSILKIKPAFAQSYISLGRNLMAQKRVDEAVANFRAALRVEPENAEAHQDLARALAQQGKVDEGARHLEMALRLLKQTGHSPSDTR